MRALLSSSCPLGVAGLSQFLTPQPVPVKVLFALAQKKIAAGFPIEIEKRALPMRAHLCRGERTNPHDLMYLPLQ